MEALMRITIKEQVYAAIKKDILTQRFQMGERINIDNLAREINVSNTPIREALNMLEKEGLVITRPNTGTQVVTLSRVDIYELSQMILFWMLGAYRFCVQDGRLDSLCAQMEECLSQQREFRAREDVYHFILFCNSFDRCILAATKNTRLLDLFDSVFSLFFLAALVEYKTRNHDWELSISQHEAILKAIREKRHDAVEDLLREHYDKPGA